MSKLKENEIKLMAVVEANSIPSSNPLVRMIGDYPRFIKKIQGYINNRYILKSEVEELLGAYIAVYEDHGHYRKTMPIKTVLYHLKGMLKQYKTKEKK
jgi:hypothetical protein